MKKKIELPLKNHFTSLSGIFVRPHDKTIDLFSMASTVSAAIVGLVLNSSSSLASVCFNVNRKRRTTKRKREKKRSDKEENETTQ